LIKIADTGLSRNMKGDVSVTFSGTLEYQAPELLCGGIIDPVYVQGDVYSFGLTILELMGASIQNLNKEITTL